MRDSIRAARQKESFRRLTEKYYGKLDLLAAWEDDPRADHDYLLDLKRRLRMYKNDLTYRGGEPE